MPREPIPEDLLRFILTSVPSVPFVEAMLVFREARGRDVDVDTLARRLYVPPRDAAEIAGQLHAAHVVIASGAAGAFRYAPGTPQLAMALDMLANFYRTHLVEVTDLIHSRTARKAQQFADAFRLRKEP